MQGEKRDENEDTHTHTCGLFNLKDNEGVVLQFLRMLPLSQLPTLLQPLRMCGGVQGCRHGSCTIKAKRPMNVGTKTCCRARSTRRTAPEATSEAKNDNTQNTQHTWAM